MKTLAQLAESDFSGIAPKVIGKQVEEIKEKTLRARNLVRLNTDLKGTAGRSIYIPKETGTLTAVEVAEGEKPSASTVGVGSTLITMGKYGALVNITQEEIEAVQLDILNYKIDRLGRALALKEDDVVLGIFTASGAVTTTQAAAANGSLGYNDVMSCVATIRGLNYDAKVLLIHPDQEGDLMKLSQFIDASKYGAREALLNGEIGKFAGVKVLVSQNMSTGSALVVDPDEAAWLVMKREVNVKRDSFPTAEKEEIAVYTEFGVKLTQPKAAAIITGC